MYRKDLGKLGKRVDRKVAVPDEDGAATGAGAGEKPVEAKKSAVLRVQSDFSNLEIPDCVELKLNKDDMLHFSFVIKPDHGFWAGGVFEFKFDLPSEYPYNGPRVTCIDKVRLILFLICNSLSSHSLCVCSDLSSEH